MNPDLPLPLAVSLALLLGLAVNGDLRAHRIPNWLSLGGLGAGIVLQLGLRGADGAADAVQGALTGGLVLLPLWLLRGMAAGDVKLMAAVGAHLGPGATVAATLATLVVGAVAALLVLIHRRRSNRQDHPRSPARRDLLHAGFAYAPAIAIGTALVAALPLLQRILVS